VIAPAESALARARRSLARIAAADGRLHSCILVRGGATDEAAGVDLLGHGGPLAGWTVAVKDNTDVAGTVRSDGLGPPHPPPATADSTVVYRLRSAGAVVVAKTNLEQLSFGATTQNPTWGSCRNPWDLSRIPGGSSGGSAVAVAAGLVDAAIGTDTGGSLRNPAAFCGVSTLRPTHGLVPMTGVTPLSPSMDVVGPMARRVADLRRLLAVLAGIADESGSQPLDGLRVGVPRAFFLEGLEQDVARGFDELLALLRACGARVSPVTPAGAHSAAEAMPILQNAEAARSLRSYWNDPRLSDGIRQRLDLGRSITSSQVELASRTSGAWRQAVEDAFQEVTVIAIPATPFAAPRIVSGNLVTLSRRINRLTGCWSLAGVPVLGIPMGLSGEGLPIGAQIVGRRRSDWRLLAIGEAIQSVSDWHKLTPPMCCAEPALARASA
jgi:aspartyl-tRNA(Asn)/glutamyl-tRNA(Gln) amidotransferase subunit A